MCARIKISQLPSATPTTDGIFPYSEDGVTYQGSFADIPVSTPIQAAINAGTGAISTVSNSDGTLTISPTTWNVVASRPAITGDISIPAWSNSATLPTVNSNVGSFTNASVTVNAKGQVTAVSNGSGGGAVDSVNWQTGVVVLDTGDIAATTDKNYVTDAQLVVLGNTSGTNTWDNATNSQYSGLATSKQDTLVSGTNIKTVNGNSLLGSGNISITWGTGDVTWPATSTDWVPALFDWTTGKAIKNSTPTGTGNPVMDTNPTFVTRINAPEIKATSSAWVDIHNSSGTQVAIFGAGGSTGASLVGTTNVGSASADYHQVAWGTGTITDTATGSSTNINVNIVPKWTGRLQAGGVNVPTISSTDTLTNKSISGGQITSAVANATDSEKIWGITVTGTPAVWYVPTATSPTAATWQAASTWSPKMKISTTFEYKDNRFTLTATGSGTTSLTTEGMILASGNPAGSMVAIWWMRNKTWASTPVCQLSLRAIASDTSNSEWSGDFFFWLAYSMAVANSGITFTDKHIGIKVVKRLSNTYDIVGTQWDGTTEAVTSTIITMDTGDTVDLIIDVLATSVVCYASVNNWAYASQTLWATNRPSGSGSSEPFFATSNRGVGSKNFNWTLCGANFEH